MIAFVMSGGGNLGALEAGAILALMEAGIKPSILVGTSAGSINAAFLATNPTLDGAKRMADIWKKIRQEDFFPGPKPNMFWRLLRGRSLFSSDALRQSLERNFPDGIKRFGDLKNIKLYITAANLNTGNMYLYGDQPGASIVDAVMASTAHPLAYPPVKINNQLLVDGGVIANVPVGIAAERGATEIYILNVGNCMFRKEKSCNQIKVLTRSINLMMYQHFLMDLKYTLENTETVVHHISISGFENLQMWDLSHSEEMVEAGKKAAEDYLKAPLGLDSVPSGVFGEIEDKSIPDGAEVYVPPCLHPSDLLGLPQQERRLFTYLNRNADADTATMAKNLNRTNAQVRIDLSSLIKKGYIRRLPEGKYKPVFGKSRRTEIPGEIWEALSKE